MRSPDCFNRAAWLEAMQAAGLEALLLTSPAGIAYTTGIDLYTQTLIPERPVFHLLAPAGVSTVLVFERERSMFETASWVREVQGFPEFGADIFTRLADLLAATGLSDARLGIEQDHLPCGWAAALVGRLPRLRLENCEELLAQVRGQKTPAEIAHLRRAARAMDQALAQAAGEVRPGEPEYRLAARIAAQLLAQAGEIGCAATAIDPLVASGPNLAVAHNTYGRRAMAPGDLVRFGCKARLGSYWCLLLRTGAIAPAAPALQEGYARYAEAFHASLARLRPGLPACRAYLAVRADLEARRLRMISEKCGHSTGVVFRDAPVMQVQDARLLAANMVLAHDFLAVDEPGSRFFVEDRVLLTAGGAELLSDVIPTTSLTILG